MAPHRANVSVISVYVSKSASLNDPRVSSENTTPQPNVASGGLRSNTVTSWEGSAFFISMAKYSPAGPPPRTPILTSGPASREDVGQPGVLREIRDGGKQHQLVAPRLLVSADELLHRLGGGEVRRGDPLGERAGERVVVAQVPGAVFGRVFTEGEVALAPHLGAIGPAHVGPRRPRLRRRASEGPRWPASVHVAVGPSSHPSERLSAQSPHQERRAPAAPSGPRSTLLPVRPHREELIREPLSPIAVLDPGDRIVLAAGADRKPQDQSSSRQGIDGCRLLGQDRGGPQRPHHHHGDQPDPGRDGGSGGQGNERVVAVIGDAVQDADARERTLVRPGCPGQQQVAGRPGNRVREPHAHAHPSPPASAGVRPGVHNRAAVTERPNRDEAAPQGGSAAIRTPGRTATDRGPASIRLQRRIEWWDTDASGNYHNTAAFRLLESAETLLLGRLGLLHDVYGRLPRARLEADFRRGARKSAYRRARGSRPYTSCRSPRRPRSNVSADSSSRNAAV